MRQSPLISVSTAILAFIYCLPVYAAPNDSARMISLTAPLKIDGDSTDWPKAPVQSLNGSDGNGSFQIASDATNFYAVVKVADASPLKNNAARPEEMLKGGDAVGLYFGNPADKSFSQRVMVAQIDGKTLVYLYRPQSKLKKPYSFVSPVGEAKFDYVASFPEAKAALRTVKGGYELEISIPWKALGWTAAPTKLAFDAQVIFSDPAGTTNSSMAWWHAKGGPGDTVEDLPSEAQLYPDTWGEAILETSALAQIVSPTEETAKPAGIPIRFDLPRAGRVSLVVTDQSGWIVRELLTAEKREKGTQTLSWDGRDRYGEPLPAGKYRWKAIVFDGMGSKFYGSVGNSSRPPYRTPDGLGSMGGQHGVPSTIAADEGGIYMGGGAEEGQPAVRKIDAKTGAALWKRSMGGFGAGLAIAAGENRACYISMAGGRGERPVSLVQIDPQTGRDIGKNARLMLPAPKLVDGKPRFVVGGMVIAGGRAFWSDTLDNQISGANLETNTLLSSISIPSPQGLARLDEQNLLVCSGTQVLKLNLTDGKMTPVLQNLVAPRAVVRDGAGNYYVSDWGDSQQIKKFSPEGKLVASWGLKGGKPNNQPTYDPMAFQNVTGLVVGPDGNLWFNEAVSTPKRFVKIATDGRWLEDFYGPVAYNTFGPDLDDFSSVYYNSGGNDSASQFIKTRLDYAKYIANPQDPAAAWKIEAIYDLSLGADGKTRNPLMADVADTGYGHVIVFTGTNGKRYLFRLSKANRAAAPAGAGLWLWENGRWVPTAFISRDEKTAITSWSDFNGDGLVQENERYSTNPVQSYAWIGRDLKLEGFDGTFAPVKVDARGVPDYRGGQFSPYLKVGELNYQDGWTFVSPNVGGATYYIANAGSDRHLAFWDRASDNRLIKVQNGVVQWVVGQHNPKGGFDTLSTSSGIAGVVGDVIIAQNVEPASYIAYTSDGFTLGNVLADENGKQAPVGPNIVNIESFTGLYTKDPKTGKNLLFSVSSGDDRILEITGPGAITRFDGEVTLDTSRPRIGEASNTTEIPYQNWIGNNANNLSIDGEADEWPLDALGIPIYDKGVLIGDIRLRRDGGRLYALANIMDATPLETGEGVELNLAPENGEATRILLSAAKDKKGAWKGTVSLEKAGAAVPATGAKAGAAFRWRNLGYRLEAEIPLELFPDLIAPSQQKVRGVTKDPRTGKMSAVETKTGTVPDLRGPIRLRTAILRRDNGALASHAWPVQGSAANQVLGIATTPAAP